MAAVVEAVATQTNARTFKPPTPQPRRNRHKIASRATCPYFHLFRPTRQGAAAAAKEPAAGWDGKGGQGKFAFLLLLFSSTLLRDANAAPYYMRLLTAGRDDDAALLAAAKKNPLPPPLVSVGCVRPCVSRIK